MLILGHNTTVTNIIVQKLRLPETGPAQNRVCNQSIKDQRRTHETYEMNYWLLIDSGGRVVIVQLCNKW